LFSTFEPNLLLDEILNYAEEKGFEFKVSNDKYKVILRKLTEDGGIEMVVNILRVDEKRNCIDFNRTKGDCLDYFSCFNEIKD
jgi:hypothetical protein